VKHTNARSLADLLLLSIFCIVVGLPAVDLALDLDPFRRDGARAPFVSEPGWRGILRLPGKLKWWFEGNFGFRDALLESHARLKHGILGVSPSEKVLLGENGWLFLKDEGNLDSYRNVYAFSEEELNDWVSELRDRDATARSLDATYLFFVAPGKPTIYGEAHLGARHTPVARTSRLEQLSSVVAHELPTLRYLDLRETLRSRGEDRRLYYQTDTHWNPLGAYEAYLELRKLLAQSLPGTLLDSWPKVGRVVTRVRTGGDLARLAGLKHVLREEEQRPLLDDTRQVLLPDGSRFEMDGYDTPSFERLVTFCPEADLESAVVFHDSFGRSMIPLLAQTFRRTVFVWSDEFDPRVVAEERPEFVIQELVERRLLRPRVPLEREPLVGFERHVYGRAEDRDLAVHLLRPRPFDVGAPVPAILLFHGGGWRHGEPAGLEALARAIAADGYAVVLAEYRLLSEPGADIEDALDDGGSALSWLQNAAPELGIDPRRIAVGGASAGAHLAFWAVRNGVAEGHPPAALLLLSGVVDTSASGYGSELLADRAHAVSPIEHLRDVLPPTLLIHAADDDVVPLASAEAFHREATRVGVSSHLVALSDAPHGFYTRVDPDWREPMSSFLTTHIGEGAAVDWAARGVSF